MDDLANIKEVQYLHETLKIDAEIDGAKEPMFTWGGLTARPKKDNPASDGGLSRKKSAEAIVPSRMPERWGSREGLNAICLLSEQ